MTGASRPQVLVTRPAREAARWVAELQARGWPAQALPLIDIAPPLDPQPVRTAWQQLAANAAVMFVSGQAVEHFFALADAAVHARWCVGALTTHAWSPGPGTSAALRRAGLPEGQIDAPPAEAGQFDSEALWARVAGQCRPGQRVLIVRGGDAQGRSAGRDWLAQQLTAAGVSVATVVAYRRIAPVLDEAQQRQARQAASNGAVWLFSSSEAVRHLVQQLPRADWTQARAVATHPRIAEAVREAGFGRVNDSRPALDDVEASIKSFA